jgi:two-component system, sensor histidine kinase and response regulator
MGRHLMPPEALIRILLVDDDPALLDALSEALSLRFEDIQVDMCDSGPSALESVSSKYYDSIITDIKMPGMDGFDLLANIREVQPEVPVLLITGHGQTDLAIRALRAGAFDLILKPLDRDYLAAALRRAVEVRRLRRDVADKQAKLEEAAAHLERQVEERTQELHEALQAKDEFLGLISHELRSPVAVIQGNVELLHRGRVRDENRPEIVSDLRTETRRLVRVIENLLVLARLEFGASQRTHSVDLGSLIEQQVEKHHQTFPHRQLSAVIPEDLPEAMCDATQLELVLVNLITNAEKYSHPDLPIEVTAACESEQVVVSVMDRGKGVPPEEADMIFTPFYRSSNKEGIPGMGIGLAVCKRLMQAQGGAIRVEHREGGGSNFVISLPAAQAAQAHSSKEQHSILAST